MKTLFLISAISAFVSFTAMTAAGIISLSENEKIAARKFFILAFVLPSPFVLCFFMPPPIGKIYLTILLSAVIILILVLLFSIGKQSYQTKIPVKKIDERDTMFSRKEITDYPERLADYYSRNPDKKELDDRFRRKPGLLSKRATQYNPVHFAAAHASFFTIKQLRQFAEGTPSGEKIELNKAEITKFIKGWSKKLGAIDCGITQLKDYHLYSHGGRGDRYGKPVKNNHKYAIAFIVEMAKEQIDSAPSASIVMESGQQYLNSGTIAVQTAEMIRQLGYSARAHIDGNYQVVCPLIARDAGLGEIGRMGLLMTPKLGPRVRISVVTTDLPLLTDSPIEEQSTIEFCRECSKCADVCPSKAIPFGEAAEIDGVIRWRINSESCYTMWTTLGTDCGRCVSVCPYSHPDNIMHNLVRAGIKNSPLFRKAAVKMDDLIYGRKPKPAEQQEWMKVKFDKKNIA